MVAIEASLPQLSRPSASAAAFLAISTRRLALSAAARALPPRRPSDCAALSLPSSAGKSSCSPPAAMRRTLAALPVAPAAALLSFWVP